MNFKTGSCVFILGQMCTVWTQCRTIELSDCLQKSHKLSDTGLIKYICVYGPNQTANYKIHRVFCLNINKQGSLTSF